MKMLWNFLMSIVQGLKSKTEKKNISNAQKIW